VWAEDSGLEEKGQIKVTVLKSMLLEVVWAEDSGLEEKGQIKVTVLKNGLEEKGSPLKVVSIYL
jgi:RNA-binding protein YhbY